MPTLYITRHGETEWNLEKRMQGWEDSPLTAKGRQNARDLGHRLREIHLDHLYISPIGRVRETVRMMDLDPAIPVTIDDRLREMHMGTWEGRTAAEIEVAHPLAHAAFWQTPHTYIPESGESFDAVRERILSFLERLADHEEDENVLIVTHGIFLNILLTYLQRKPFATLWDPPFIHGTSLTIVEYRDGEAVIRLEADMSHVIAD
ncbi:histidine phosphatase family protein [Exiguobacterium sp. PHA03]|uniref:histidine phosphatase family protein n=1 Tax=Exiguobacterium sp. PHA03 TaxID=3064895 RepID=UPI0035BF98BC